MRKKVAEESLPCPHCNKMITHIVFVENVKGRKLKIHVIVSKMEGIDLSPKLDEPVLTWS